MLATSVSNNLAESRTNKFPFMATSVGGLFQFVRLTQSGRDKQNIKPSRMTQRRLRWSIITFPVRKGVEEATP